MKDDMINAAEMKILTEHTIEDIIIKYSKLYTEEIYESIMDACSNGFYRTELYPSESEELVDDSPKYTAFLYATDKIRQLGYKLAIHKNYNSAVESLSISWN